MRNKHGLLSRMIFTWFFVLATYAFACGQSFRVDAKLDSNSILIGDQVYLNLHVTQPEGARVNFPVIEKQKPSAIEIIKTYPKDTTALEGQHLEIRQRILLTSFDTGRVEWEPMKFTYHRKGSSDSMATPPLALAVQPVQVDTTTQIFDIKSPFGAPVTFREALPYILAFLGLVLIIGGIYYILRKRKKQQPLLQPRKPAEPAHVYARRELDKLKRERLWQHDRVKAYYIRLTEILRTYLWMRYKIKTLERTTDEILDALKSNEFSDDQLFKRLEDTLRLGDLVKFAKLIPSPTENEQCMEFAYDFVSKTQYVPAQEKSDAPFDNTKVPVTNDKTSEDKP